MFVLHAVLMNVSNKADAAQGTSCCTAQSYWTKRRKANEVIKSWQSVPASANSELHCGSLLSSINACVGYHRVPVDTHENQPVLGSCCEGMQDINPIRASIDTPDYEIALTDTGIQTSSSSVDEHCEFNLPDNFEDRFDSDSSCSNETDLFKELADWAVEFRVPNAAVDKMLKILHSNHPQLPLTCRTLLQTGKLDSEVMSLTCGQYMHYGILAGLQLFEHDIVKLGQTELFYQVNIDGLPLFKSSSTQLWPILGQLVGIKPCPFLIGSF